PTTWMVLEQMPLGSAGKVDRRALPQPQAQTAEYVAPTSDREMVAAQVFADVLGVERVGLADSFFDVGGNSLAAMRVAARLGEALGVEVSVRDVFDTPVLGDLVAALSDRPAGLSKLRPVTPRPEVIPLSFAQQRIWFINQFDVTSPAYNIPVVLRLSGPLDVTALRVAVVDVVIRHEILRTTFESVSGGAPEQIIHPPESVEHTLDFAVVGTAADLEDAVRSGFDVTRQWPIRVRIAATGPGEHLMALVLHHIAADGESLSPLLGDLIAAYSINGDGSAVGVNGDGSAVGTRPALPVQFADVALWQRDALGAVDDPDSVLGRQLAYWSEHLAGLPEVLDLPADRARPAIASQRGARLGFEVPAPVAERIAAVAQRHNATAFMVVHSALAALMARLTATDDIAVATPIAGRGDRLLDDLVGMFVNTLVLRTRVDVHTALADLLEQVRGTDLDAFAHADVPFEAVVEALAPTRSEAFAPLAQVMVTLDGGAVPELAAASVAGTADLRVESVVPEEVPAKLDLTVGLSTDEPGRSWAGTLIYATDLFDEATMVVFAERFVRLLDALTADPSLPIADADWIGGDEVAHALALSAGPVVAYEAQTVADAIVTQILATPTAVAVQMADRSTTYGEFGIRVSELARRLIATGVGPGVAVGIAIDRSVEMLVAIHAVVAAGAQYVPIDTAAPAERVASMVDTARVALILVGAQVPPAVGALGDEVSTIVVDTATMLDPDATFTPITDAERLRPLRTDDALYTLFTSGSTGRPKGVTVSHRAVYNRLRWGLDAFAWSAGDRILQKTPYTFDVSVPELFAPLMSGATVVVAEPGGHADPVYIADLIESVAVTSVHFVPSMLSVFLDVVEQSQLARLTSLRWVFASGEALPAATVARLHRAMPWVEIHNLFGPTEAAVEVTGADVTAAPDVITIGTPVPNTTALVLDARLRPVPAGVPGELYLGGVQIADGYARAAVLTAERFVADPYGAAGARLYRTGDLVRRNASGAIEYLGRTDFQVKLRGQRIELGEIESVLVSAPGVVHAAAAVAVAPTGAQHLVAYLSPASVDVGDVRARIAAALPEYMRPTVWMTVDELALNSAGKLDRRALPTPDFGGTENEYVAPEGPVEEQLAAVIGALLGVERISATESFFALGGDSIMSIQLASAARAGGLTLSPRDIFEHRTVRAMARALSAQRTALPDLTDPAGGNRGEVPIPPVVSWMLELSDTPDDFADFSQSMVLAAPAGLTVDDLAELLAELLAVHPALATRLDVVDGGARMTVGVDVDLRTTVTETSVPSTVGSDEYATALREAHASASASLDPGAGVTLAARLVHDRDGNARIVLVLHHLSVDAVSWPILIEDLVTAWSQRAGRRPVELRAEATSERGWYYRLAQSSADRTHELDHWLQRLGRATTPLGASIDRSRDRAQTTVSVTMAVDASLTEPLVTDVPAALRGNVNDVLLGALARAVRSWQVAREILDEQPVTVLVEGHGRQEELVASGADPRRADLSRTVGWFTTISPLALDPADDVVHAVKAAKEERLGQPDSGAGFGWLRYGPHGTRTDTELARRPLPAIGFNYFGAGGRADDSAGTAAPFAPTADVRGLGSSASGAMVVLNALTVNVGTESTPQGRNLVADIAFPAGMFDAADIDDLAGRWRSELAALVETVTRGDDLGHSPSDVPGSGVTQHDLDALAHQYPGADVWPLTPLQRGLYFESERAGSGADTIDVYVTQAVVSLGAVDLERLRRAAQRLFDEHRVLRSGYVRTASGAVVAVVPATVEVPWHVVDLDGSADGVAAEVRALADAERIARFDLSSPPLVRFTVVRHRDGAEVIITNHHLLLDGWSGPLVLADLLALYATGTSYTGRTRSGEADFATHLMRVARADVGEGLEAWRSVLAPVEGATLVAPGIEATAAAAPHTHSVTLDDHTTTALEDLARSRGVTISTVMQFAWAVLLSRLTGQRVVTFGETVSGRPADLDGVETMVGLFINTLPAVVDVDPDATIGDALSRLQAAKVSVLDHQHLGLPDLVALTGVSGALFDTLTVHESYPIDTASLESTSRGSATGELDLRAIDSRDSTHYPLNLATMPDGERMRIRLSYLPTAFDAAQVEVFAETVREILGTVVDQPDALLADIPIMSEDRRREVRGWACGSMVTATGVSGSGTDLAGRVADMLSAYPDRVAIVEGDRKISNAEFGSRVWALARRLIAHGVGPDTPVAVCLPRSAEMVIAIHAVVAAGG
ncbi:MAG: amino acid adenylation domain-containing protein, partial [Gordonia polyisoprenivorans]|nr:amino acid adenylation domain-containing protein [Gordonia polyisoprenivorans]